MKRSTALLGTLIVPIMILSLLAGCAKPKTITLAWLPNNSGDNEKVFRQEFDKVIADATGAKVQDKLTTDYNIAIAALDSGDAQLGWFGPFEYMTGHARNSHVVPLVVESGDSGTAQDALYHSRLLVKKGNENLYKSGSGFSIQNIEGKRISFVSTSSTSGFNMPSAAILAFFHNEDKWKSLSKDDLMQGGKDKFFGQVMFSGSHQLSLANLLMGKVDVAAVDDIDVQSYLDLTSGTANQEGSVYTIKKGADAPFDSLAGAQFVVIKSIPVQNTPFEANNAFLDQATIDKITAALLSDKVTNDPLVFAPKDAQGAALFVQPHRFVKVDDSWYDPMREVLGIK
ncbi:MAG: phosphate/phosphite/phosphonate ABC transporter substrate-binding protein [Treponema sp.]|nr:phosphate/phosphite/phosphonate ABC transporter substrate-binding protein [Treponema sp.]